MFTERYPDRAAELTHAATGCAAVGRPRRPRDADV